MISDALHKLDSGIELFLKSLYHSLIRPKTYWLIDPTDGTASWYEGYMDLSLKELLAMISLYLA